MQQENIWTRHGVWKMARDTNHLFLNEGFWSACSVVEIEEVEGEQNEIKPTCEECKGIEDGPA